MNSALFIFLVGELILLYFLSRQSINHVFLLLRRMFHHDRIVYSLVAFLFFLGTVIHELAHFVMATILFLRVRDIHVFPEWDGKTVKLGKVLYEKKDVVRSILVGVAPLFVGLLIIWWLYYLQILSTEIIWLRILSIVFVFILTTSMFSSKQDLVDILYLIPLGILGGLFIFIFQIDIMELPPAIVLEAGEDFLYAVVRYLAIAIAIHIGLIAGIKALFAIFK